MTADFLENLLTWARNQMQKIESKPKNLNLKEIAFENVELLTPMAAKKGVKLDVKISNELEAFADPNMINLVVRNLLVNAIKFSSNGDTVLMSAHEDTGKCVFNIQDTGIGIDNEILHKIFDLETYSTSGTANEKGSGLGLILCKDFVEKNNGTIWANSEVGKGSVFSFSIPLTPQNEAVPA